MSRQTLANRDSIIWSESACRIALAGVRCMLGLLSDKKQTYSQFDKCFAISLPVSLAFFTVMIGDMLASKASKFHLKAGRPEVNRSTLAFLCGCETWQMVSMCLLEDSRPLAQLLIFCLVVIVMVSIPEKHSLQWFSAAVVLSYVCVDVFSSDQRPSRLAFVLYASAAICGAVANSKFFKYFIHFCIVAIDFYRNDCMLSGMIMMVAVSRIGVAMAHNADVSGGLPVPWIH